MKSYPLIAQKIYAEPWLITKEKHHAIQTLFEAHVNGEKAFILDGEEEGDESEPRRHGDKLVIPVHGILGKHLSQLEMMCGGCSVDQISKHIDAAEQNYAIREVIFDFRSPGGAVVGIPELAGKIRSMSKDTVAFTDAECCSGALWLASQADRFHCTESAMIGSVGVYAVFTDRSRQLEEAGVTVNAISAGKFKLAGASFKAMTEEERAMFQARVDRVYSVFKEAVKLHREIPDEFLQGQIFYGDEAMEHGFVDGIIDDIEELF